MHILILYHKPTCGYCRKVLRFIEEHKLTVRLKSVSENPAVRQELIDLTGRTQVPCLIHDGEILYESDDIVAWLAENSGDS